MSGTLKPLPITILDGGMGREMLRMGAPFRQPEWSALSLMETPELVRKAHESFASAGCDILTTSNYAVIPYHIGEQRFLSEGTALTARSGQLARDVASRHRCRVAGSLPPLFGSYRPDLFDPPKAPAMLKTIIEALDPFVDLWLAETTSSIGEIEAVAAALAGDSRPLWISYTLLDGEQAPGSAPCLRSGETVIDAAKAAVGASAAAILFNCSQPEVMAPALSATIEQLQCMDAAIPVGVYANAFPSQQRDARANSTLFEIRQDLDPAGYLDYVDAWCRLGASIIGGCCGIGPEHILAVSRRYKKG